MVVQVHDVDVCSLGKLLMVLFLKQALKSEDHVKSIFCQL